MGTLHHLRRPHSPPTYEARCATCGEVHGAVLCPVERERERWEHRIAFALALMGCFAFAALGLYLVAMAEGRVP